ncbi:MAG: hypothetical protein KC910_16600 [Candidatus Eremiobacteraeota bacterium]|nr:hypothetical protein [Candidatus Eremiobacteraeota bacterium]
MNVSSATLRESQPRNFTRVDSAPQVNQNSNASNEALNQGAFSSRAVSFTTNTGVRQVLSEVLGAPASSNAFRTEETVPLEGYDYNKLNNPDHNTPKYIFGRVAQHYKLDSVQGDKAKAEQLLTAMLPELREAGLEVVGVEGDRIQVKTEVGYEWVDVVRGAGSDNPGWWWGSEGKGTTQPTANSKQWAAATGQNGGNSNANAFASFAPVLTQGKKATPLGNSIDRAAVMAIVSKYPPTNEGIQQAMPELQERFPGVQLLEHPQRLDKLKFPNGAVVDVVVGAGGNEPTWGWNPEN